MRAGMLACIVLLPCWMVACASAQIASEPQAALLKARLVAVDLLPRRPSADIDYVNSIRHTFRITKVLIGAFDKHELTFAGDEIGVPEPGYDYFIVVKRTSDGPEVISSFPDIGGLCIDEKQAKSFGLDVAAVEALNKQYPCH
jgi:hypothetical protein